VRVKLFKGLVFLGLIGLGLQPLHGGLKVTASVDRKIVPLQGTFTWTVEVEDAPTMPVVRFPKLRSFAVVSGPVQSTNFTWINGKATTTKSISYTLAALEPGTQTIPAIQVKIGGRYYRTQPITIEVTQLSSKAPQTAPRTKTQRQTRPRNIGQRLFLKAIPSKTRVVLGEPLTVTYRLYTQVDVFNPSIDKMPTGVGFWAEEVPAPRVIDWRREVKEGVRYRTADLSQMVFYPTKAGTLRVDPMRLSLQVKVPRRRNVFNDPFFNDPFFSDPFFNLNQVVNKQLVSNPVTVYVDPFPEPVPADFSGAVGRFSLVAHLDTNRVQVNDAVGFSLTLKGRGNFKSIQVPDFNAPPQVDLFKPEKKEEIKLKDGAYQGWLRVTWLLVPRREGEITLPAITWSYLDPQTRRYRRLSTKPVTLHVAPLKRPQPVIATGYSRSEVQVMSKDIRFIKEEPGVFRPLGMTVWHSRWYWGLWLVGLVTALGALTWDFRQQRLMANPGLRRKAQAWDKAQQRVKQARKLSPQDDGYYAALEQALRGLVEDRLNLPGGLATRELREYLERAQVPSDTANHFGKLLERLALGRYAPEPLKQGERDLVQEVQKLLKELGKWL